MDNIRYRHAFLDDSPCEYAPGKVLCIGKNYRAALNEPVNLSGDHPVLFMKPASAMVQLENRIAVPDYGKCYYEAELAVLIGSELKGSSRETAEKGIVGYAMALDLTLKELLDEMKQKGRPWELAKSFDRSCPISPFVNPAQIKDPNDTLIQLAVNGEIKQKATTKLMMRDVFELVALISRYFTLLPGDVVLTGTPDGSGVLPPGASITLTLDERYRFETSAGPF